MTNTIDDDTFVTEVLESLEPVLLDFTATWCAPCRVVSPVIDKLSKEYEGKMKIVKMDIDEAPQTTNKFDIRGVPTFIFFRDGIEVERWVGAGKSEKDFKKKIEELV
jgi:thioredoxin 1